MMRRRAVLNFVRNPLRVAETIEQIFEDDLHARRVASLANGVVGQPGLEHGLRRFRRRQDACLVASRIDRYPPCAIG